MCIAKRYCLAVFFAFGLISCGLPSSVEVPAAPVSVDKDSETDNNLAFITPSDGKIDRYVIWYKIYPFTNRTTTDGLIDKDSDHFADLGVRSASEIRKRDFHELYLSSSFNDGYYYFGLGSGVRVTISKDPDPSEQANYIKVAVAGGKTYNVRRNVAVSGTDTSRKVFYGDHNLDTDNDIKGRKSSDFSSYSSVDKGFAIAFLAQSAYINAEDLDIVSSVASRVGVIYSSDGFEDS